MRKFSLLVVLALSASMLVACGGAAKPSNTINVTFTEFSFTPDEFTIPAGQEITVSTINNGAVVHEFVIMKHGMTVGENFGSEDEDNIYWEIETEAGKSSTGTFTAPSELGEYQIVCGTEGHYVAGMIGTLTVVAP